MKAHTRLPIILLALLSALLMATTASAEDPSILSLTPVGTQSCIAVAIDSPEGSSLVGLDFLNNDGTVPFPYVVLMEGTAGSPPDLADTALILEQVSGASLAWGSADLQQPVASSTGLIYAVFVLPSEAELLAKGQGGGPGLGIAPAAPEATPAPIWLTADGVAWLAYDPTMELGVSPRYGSGKRAAVTLASLKGSATLPFDLPGQEVEEPPVLATALVGVHPNPFNPRTEIRFDLARAGTVDLQIYNLRGQLVRTVVHENMPAGHHVRIWQGDDDRGQSVASGVYVVLMQVDHQSFRKKLTLLR